MPQLVLPRVHAMLLCDDVIESEEEIGVFQLIGVRTSMEVATFPTVHTLRVFAHLSGHKGQVECHGVIERADSGELVGETEPLDISLMKPTLIVVAIFEFTNCVFSAPGVYYVQLYHEQKLIGERRFSLRIEA